MGKLVNLGQGIYAFVRPINKFIVLPVFDFFQQVGWQLWHCHSIAHICDQAVLFLHLLIQVI